ncbi:MAG: hypothetical protein DMF40_16605, partial [Verrucomicrobia bacterium]
MKFVTAALFMLLGKSVVLSATFQAASVSMAAINAAIARASDGDTVVVPAGVAKAGTTNTNTGTVTDATVLLDNVPRGTGQSAALIKATLAPNQSFRLTGFTFRPGTTSTKANNGAVRLSGKCFSVRIDHCHFEKLYQADQIHTYGWLYGVVDHCVIDCRGGCTSLKIWHDTWADRTKGD